MNCARTVNSAIMGVPTCARITISKTTMAHHCQRELLSRSIRFFKVNSLWGAIPRISEIRPARESTLPQRKPKVGLQPEVPGCSLFLQLTRSTCGRLLADTPLRRSLRCNCTEQAAKIQECYFICARSVAVLWDQWIP